MSAETTLTNGTAAATRATILDVRLFIDGSWQDGGDGSLAVRSPWTGLEVGSVALASRDDLDRAVAAAERAFPEWAAQTADSRGAILKRAADLLETRADEIARILAIEGGKTETEARGELARGIDTMRWNGEQAGRTEGRIYPGKTSGAQRLSIPTPVGAVAAFTAWNFPAVLATRKLGAILAAGCTVVLKAAEATPGTAAEIVRALADAGAPAGTVNLVFGDPPAVSEHLITAPQVRAVTFTGSTPVGRIIAGLAATGPKRAVLELGGHAPVIVDRSADIGRVIATTLPAKVGSAGQSCVAPTRYLVHRKQIDAFTEQFTTAMSGLQPGVDLSPVINERRLAALEQLVSDAVARGGRLLCGGARLDRDGYFFAPTVLADVPAKAEVLHEEPFGPIATINRFTDIDDAIAQANATEYAFAAYVFTESLVTRARVLASLRASNVGINQLAPSLPDAPLGGMQASGLGYEGGADGIAAFQHMRLISEAA
jgi:succinate-semialdehyde dehydrogenase/glutarate-semialdehyde dehydrogenase